MSARRVRLQATNDVFLHMGDKAFFDNEYAIAPPSLIKGLENPYDRNGLTEMQLIREMCQKMEDEPIKDQMNPGAVDMRYAFGGGKKPGNPTPRIAEVYDHLLKRQQIMDFSEHNRHLQESLRDIHTAGDIDILNRALEGGLIDTSDPRILNNPLLNQNAKLFAMPKQGKAGGLTGVIQTGFSNAVKTQTGTDLPTIVNTGNQVLDDPVDFMNKFI